MQGYIYTTQALGTQALYLKCKTSEDDCAVFLEPLRPQFEAAGYTATLPGAATSLLGYAYGTANSDNDTLPDAMEYVIGTNRFSDQSDNDNIPDDIEFPLAGVSFNDPCSEPNPTCAALPESLFANGFE